MTRRQGRLPINDAIAAAQAMTEALERERRGKRPPYLSPEWRKLYGDEPHEESTTAVLPYDGATGD